MDGGAAMTSAERARAIRSALGGRAIVMIGLMGAGKSAIGKRLAAWLELPFSDADQEIERAAGRTISDIFAENGESYFRDGERRVLARLLAEGPKVLATGGGAFMNPETRARIAEAGISVWLRADLDTLMQRVMRRDNRPLLKAPDPRAVMQKLIAERYPVYAEADLVIDSRDVAHEVIVDEIVRALRNCPKLAGPPVQTPL
jgi:shikimate kinase